MDGQRYSLSPTEYVVTVNDDSVEESYQKMSTKERANG